MRLGLGGEEGKEGYGVKGSSDLERLSIFNYSTTSTDRSTILIIELSKTFLSTVAIKAKEPTHPSHSRRSTRNLRKKLVFPASEQERFFYTPQGKSVRQSNIRKIKEKLKSDTNSQIHTTSNFKHSCQ